MTDSEKLRILAEYFDKKDELGNLYGFSEVQKDLRRIADELDRNQTNPLLIAMLESQLKLNLARRDDLLKYSNLGVNYLQTLTTIEELERQLNELKK